MKAQTGRADMNGHTTGKSAANQAGAIETSVIDAALDALGDWLEAVDYRGNDPYQLDGVFTQAAGRPLIGPLVGFARRVLKPYHALIPRRVFSATRPILIPQALGDALSGEGCREPSAEARRRAARLFDLIGETRSPLARNDAWGLPFPWGGNYRHPSHWPTTISTTFVLNGLLDAIHLLDREAVLRRVDSGIEYMIDECGIIDLPEGVCIKYGQGDTRPILNSSAAAAAVFVLAAPMLGRPELLELAHRAFHFVVHHQNKDGSWCYAPAHGEHRVDTIIDSRHTGYILEAMAVANEVFDDPAIATSMEAGWRYVETSLLEDEKPRWSPQETWPVDAHDVSQSILTALALGRAEIADLHVTLAIERFYGGEGLFRYKLFRDGKTNDTVFIRWTQAPMYKALARYRRDR